MSLPIDGEVREVVADLCLIPVGLERGTEQAHSIAGLTLSQIGDSDISRIHEMLTWKHFLLGQIVILHDQPDGTHVWGAVQAVPQALRLRVIWRSVGIDLNGTARPSAWYGKVGVDDEHADERRVPGIVESVELRP